MDAENMLAFETGAAPSTAAESGMVPNTVAENGAVPNEPDAAETDEFDDEFNDILWGVQSIARFIRRSPSQADYLVKKGALNGAVRKLGHKTIVGSKRKLRALICG